jgi:HlyD family secretion protein
MKRKTQIGLAIVLLIIVAGLVVAFRPAAVPVETAAVTRGPLQEVIEEEGKTRMHDHFVVAATVSGKLRRIQLHAGDPVRVGDVLAWLDPSPINPRDTAVLQARLDAALASQREADALVGRANAENAKAATDLRRTRALVEQAVASKESLDNATTAASSAAKQLEAATSRAQSAAYQVQEARSALMPQNGNQPSVLVAIRSPVGGRVLRLLEQSERVLAPGTPIIEIGYMPKLEVVADFLTRDVVRVSPGMDALITDWGGTTPLRARVRMVEPGGFTKISALGVEEQRANIVLDLLDRSDKLADGYRVEVQIITWQGSEVTKIPVSAIFRSGENWAVFKVQNGMARQRQIQIGHRGEFEIEVQAALNPGDIVITHPIADVKEATRVRAAD